MNTYELLYIIPTQYSETEITGVEKTVSGLIEKAGGEISKTKNLGKIKLAYPIKKSAYGTYVLVFFQAEPSVLKELNRNLRIAEEVLRHVIVTVSPAAQEKEYLLEAYTAPLGEDGMPIRRKKPLAKKSAVAIAPPAPIKSSEASSLSLEELDKKLDEILEQDFSKDL